MTYQEAKEILAAKDISTAEKKERFILALKILSTYSFNKN